MPDDPHTLLLATSVGRTELPEDPALAAILGGEEDFLAIVARHPESSLGWALLAEGALSAGSLQADLTAYAFARTGYHRGLDALRRAGWRGAGPIPWEHEPNRGFLRALWALARAAERIGETAEHERCATFLAESSPEAHAELSESARKTE
ncbi:MAG: DUF3151 domain-containing protein [Nigerium sp.]|nr:DUF3151 domain-containing protein [Nigerium sp.]